MNDNPLQQYFRRPAVFLKLPSGGKFYPAGTLNLPENKELPIYPMTAIDEITSKTPDALFNGSAVTEVIKSCVPSILDPWELPMIDLDPILLAIRAATSGSMMDVTSVCPKCTESGEYNVNLTSLLGKLRADNYSVPEQISELTFKFRPLSYKKMSKINSEQFEIEVVLRGLENITDENQRRNESSATMKRLTNLSMGLLTESIESITTPNTVVDNREHILEFIGKCEHRIHTVIKDKIISLRKECEIQPVPIKCVSCSHDYEQQIVLNISDFFA